MHDHTRSDIDISALLERLERLMRAEEYEAGLNPAQWEALRYLARCNRFSNSPGALTAFLGATKGTVSQTLLALERKGMVSRMPRPGEGRSIQIVLTDKGRDMLSRDPRRKIDAVASGLDSDIDTAMRQGVYALLQDRVTAMGLKTFGLCRSCRHFRRLGSKDDPAGPHRCALLDLPLAEADTSRLCVEHQDSLETAG